MRTVALVALALGAWNDMGCDEQPPPVAVSGKGACCTDDGCTTVAEATSCTGVFFPDESCAETSRCAGACCTVNGCFFTRNRNECIGLGGEFRGPATSCNDPGICDTPASDDTTDSEQVGICCVGTTCREIPLDQCTETVFFEADSCNDVDCTKGACCFRRGPREGECGEIPKTECEVSAFNSFAGNGTTCANTNCEVGACCQPDGSSCTEVNVIDCESGGGVFLGTATDCNHRQCLPTPCCNSDGTCTELLPEACRSSGGSVVSEGKSCADAPCAQGLCCALFPSEMPFGDCRDNFSSEGGCQARAGTFAGFGLTCDKNTFEPETLIFIGHVFNDPPTGAFGLADGASGPTTFDLNINFSFNPAFPIRVQAFLDPEACPSDATCPVASSKLEFRIERSEAQSLAAHRWLVTISDWRSCPGLITVTKFVEPWQFRILDAHCVASDSELLLLECSK